MRTVCCAPGASKKRLFEPIAEIICTKQPTLLHDDVLDRLIAREKPGSTGMRNGIAIPHCRVSYRNASIGALVTLEEPIPFEARDDKPVDLLSMLLVWEEANQHHVDSSRTLPGYSARKIFARNRAMPRTTAPSMTSLTAGQTEQEQRPPCA